MLLQKNMPEHGQGRAGRQGGPPLAAAPPALPLAWPATLLLQRQKARCCCCRLNVDGSHAGSCSAFSRCACFH